MKWIRCPYCKKEMVPTTGWLGDYQYITICAICSAVLEVIRREAKEVWYWDLE